MSAPEPPFEDLEGAEIRFELDERAMGAITIKGQNVSDLVTRAHLHMSAGHPPSLVLEIIGFRLDMTAIIKNASLNWKPELTPQVPVSTP